MAESSIQTVDASPTTNISKDETSDKNDYIEIEIPFHLLQCLSSPHCNVQKLCRICLSSDNCSLTPLMSTKGNELLVLSDIFTSFTSIKLCSDDGLPSQICTLCKTQLVQCYEFKIKCEKADYALKSLLKGEIFTKNETQDEGMPTVVEANDQSVEVKTENCNSDGESEYLEDTYIDNDFKKELPVITSSKEKKKKKDCVGDDLLLIEKVTLKEKLKGKGKTSYKCSFCCKVFLKTKVLKAHIKQNHSTVKYPYLCTQCKESFMSEHDLHLHSALHVKGSWKCNKCFKEFKAKPMLRRHIQRHMESKRFTCGTCGKSFAELYALRRHSRVHTGEIVEKKYACHLCDKRYAESGPLAAHVARHSGARPCACARCGKAFASPRLLTSHALVHSDHKPHRCCYCDRAFRHESTRNTHQRTHTGERPYVCSVCGKTFIQNSNLTLHMRTHTGEKPYSCDICKRKFTSCSSLKTHQRTHTGEKPYSCNICGKRFARINITAHMRGHTGERPFACSVCPKKFVSASRLRDHCRIHTGETPFECTTCALKFPTKSHLTRHEKGHKSKKKIHDNNELIIVQETDSDIPFIVADDILISNKDSETEAQKHTIKTEDIRTNEAICLDMTPDIPIEVTGELVLQNDNNIKSELIMVDESRNNCENYQDNSLCLDANRVLVNSGMNSNDVNLVTLNEGEVSIAASSAVFDGTTIKLYQLDQSLVQIHSSGGQVTISKITSKMTANF